MNIGKAITECRKARNISRKELARRSGLSLTAIYNLENNVSFPTKNTIQILCEVIGIPISFLMVYSLTEEDVPQEKREAFRYLINPLKEFLSHE